MNFPQAPWPRLLRPHYARGDDEAHAFLREAFTPTGDLQISGSTLHVRLDPASAPRRSKALDALCTEVTGTATRHPGTATRHRNPPPQPATPAPTDPHLQRQAPP